MRPIKYFFSHPKDILTGFMRCTAPYWPDKLYLKIVYYLSMGRRLNLNHPKTYTEKLNWLKVNEIHPEYAKFVDKYEVKDQVKRILGNDSNIIKTIGVWESLDDIDFTKLPNQFVLKTTNGGGNTSVVICRDKSQFNIANAREKLNLVNSRNLYLKHREYPYYNVAPRIIVEEYIDAPNNELSDFKIFCLNGVPKFLFVGTERQKEGTDVKFDFYDADFNHLPIKNGHDNAKVPMKKPKNFDEMIEIAKKLSKGFINVRIDLYNVNGKIYFGEMTFFHFGGFVPFDPPIWDEKFGEMLKLPIE